MQKSDDILLKKGDIVDYYSYVNDDYSLAVIINDKVTSKHFQELNECKITKIQRPIKYETIYEVSKPILDKKEYLGNLKLSDILLFENYIIVYKDKNGVKHTYHIEKKFSGRRADKFWRKGIFGDGCKIIKIVDNTGIVLYEKNYNILDRTEKEYLKMVLTPLKKNRKIYISKVKCGVDGKKAYLHISIYDDFMCFPTFNIDKMYKGMELDRRYKLKELGLFKE